MIDRTWANIVLDFICDELLRNGASFTDRGPQEVKRLKNALHGYDKDTIIEHVVDRRSMTFALPDGEERTKMVKLWKTLAELVVDLER